MRLALVTDAWLPQVNGVVTTLLELVQQLERLGHEVLLIEPSGFKRFACPGCAEIELAWWPARRVAALTVPRSDALARAHHFNWDGVVEQFLGNLVPARRGWMSSLKMV